jgi:membrane protease YdiL (CAAX protease family)
MSALLSSAPATGWPTARRTALAQTILLLAALSAATLVRALVNGSTAASAFAAGALFGVTLLTVAVMVEPRLRRERPSLRTIALGLFGGAAIVAVPVLIGPTLVPIAFRPEPLALWAAITCLVAVGEEALLRGALLDTATAALGLVPAILLTSAAFALMHVPLYGWAIVPIDFGAGLALCGLRLLSGGITAPAIAHAVADLATWWI